MSKTKLTIWLVISTLLLTIANTAAGRTIYVDANAAPGGDGSNWADAYNYLQDALAEATANLDVNEIRVAEGTYRPDEDSNHPDGTGDRAATFQLINGVAIYGGYAGYGEPDPNALDVCTYETILSGDLAGDDVDVNKPPDLLDEPSRAENSYHVVTGSGTNEAAVLDGFTIKAGNAAGPWPDPYRGAGMLNLWGQPTVTNCTFTKNCAAAGAGMWNTFASPNVTNCTFKVNFGSSHAGGMVNYGSGSKPRLTNCTFHRNEGGWGGAMSNFNYGSPTVSDSTFTANHAEWSGGGIYSCCGSNPNVTNCIFSGNKADVKGGGIYSWCHNCSPRTTNCTFTGNSAGKYGGGIHTDSEHTVTACIMWGNIAKSGGNEISVGGYWSDHTWVPGTITVSYSDIQGGAAAVYLQENDCTLNWDLGNVDIDPCFVESGYWNPNATPDDSNDDYWVDGDYHLQPGSPCIDAGDNNSVPADTADLDGDGNTTEPIPFDLEGNPRIFDGNGDGNSIVDMGAYEFFMPPLEVWMKFTPQALNPGSKGNWMKAHFVLPEEYGVEDVDANRPAVVEPGGIESDYMNVFLNDDGLVEIEAAFDRAEFCSIVTGGEPMEVMVVGSLTSGQQFYGTDTIKITSNYFEYLAALASHWLQADCDKPDWCDGADLDQNSLVNFSDFALFDGCCIEVVKD